MRLLKFILSALILTTYLTTSLLAQTPSNGPQIVFEKDTHDYGDILMHGDGNCEFKFTNTGNEPLLLTNVRAGCGCTVPQWPREPINPGDTASIKVRYTTLNRPHQINRSIVVTSNATNRPTQVLRLTGNVISSPAEFTPEKPLDPGAVPSSGRNR